MAGDNLFPDNLAGVRTSIGRQGPKVEYGAQCRPAQKDGPFLRPDQRRRATGKVENSNPDRQQQSGITDEISVFDHEGTIHLRFPSPQNKKGQRNHSVGNDDSQTAGVHQPYQRLAAKQGSYHREHADQ